MLIVAAQVFAKAAERDAYVAVMADFVKRTRQEPGCLDVVIAADPVRPDRINNFERWESRETLDRFRARADPPETSIEFLHDEGAIYEIASQGPLFPDEGGEEARSAAP